MSGCAGKYYEDACPECGEIYRVYGGGPGKCEECGWDAGEALMKSLGWERQRDAQLTAMKRHFQGD